VRALIIVLVAQVALGAAVIAMFLTGNVPFLDGVGRAERPAQRPAAAAPCDGGRAPRPATRAFDGRRAWGLVRRQVALGPRPAGSAASRRLAADLRRRLPRGRFQPVPGGLRNVVGEVRGARRGRVVVGAHYDTKDLPGFVGANDGASGTAVVVELARALRRGRPRPTVTFVLFDGEESPAGTPDSQFAERGLRGSRVAARAFRSAEAMILLDFVGDRELSIPREAGSDERLWAALRAAARRAGVACVFPDAQSGGVLDDHVPFQRMGVPAIDLIDFDFPCYHQRCDDLSAVSERNLDAVGETVLEMLRRM
jgi:hypothetical protein